MNSVRAVDRAVDILEALASAPDGMKITRLEEATGIARPTLYRLVATLVNRGLLRQCDDPTRYALDIGILGLAQPWMRSADADAYTDQALQELAVAVGETVGLCVRRGAQRVFVREIVSPQPLKYTIGVGATESLVRGAGGLAILAFLEPEEADRIIGDQDAPSRRDLERSIESIRAEGFALSESQILDGATAIAAPFYDRQGACVGSVGVYGPSVRLSGVRITEVVAALLSCARRISEKRP